VPNYEVAPAYQAVTVTTTDDRSVTGWVVAETEVSVTLRTAAGAEEIVLRRNLAGLTASGVSLMPDGLEQTMSPAELSALLAYLKGGATGG
jgi:putative heme-binding domain-containing protein